MNRLMLIVFDETGCMFVHKCKYCCIALTRQDCLSLSTYVGYSLHCFLFPNVVRVRYALGVPDCIAEIESYGAYLANRRHYKNFRCTSQVD